MKIKNEKIKSLKLKGKYTDKKVKIKAMKL